MILNLVLLVLGLSLIVFGADFLVDGASSIARKSGISEFVIGLTVVGFGTSCPELVVSIMGAVSGNSDIALGNVIGSNVFNSMFILGLTAVLAPVAVSAGNRKRDIPLVIFVSVLLAVTGLFIGDDGGISRIEGIIFLVIFATYIYYCFRNGSKEEVSGNKPPMNLPKSVIYVLFGLGGLIFGGELFVDSATNIARQAGVSDKVIAITLLAGGTSLPELATCIVAIVKKRGQLALGNILGSNVFNILLILGCASIISPLSFKNISYMDIAALLLSQLLIFTAAYIGKRDVIDRFDGVLMLLCEAAYLSYLFIVG